MRAVQSSPLLKISASADKGAQLQQQCTPPFTPPSHSTKGFLEYMALLYIPRWELSMLLIGSGLAARSVRVGDLCVFTF